MHFLTTQTFRKGLLGICVTAAFSLSQPAHAERDYGNVDCGQWLENRNGPLSIDQVSDIRWLGGYLSGMNTAWTALATDNLKDPLRELHSLDQALIWMDNYCKSKPLETVKMGAVELFMELVQRRQRGTK